MILQLQREVAAMRREFQGQRGQREGKSARQVLPDGEAPALAAGWEKTKAGGVFRAYDKNGDQFVALDEWLAMTNGNISPARRKLQTQRFLQTRPGPDNKLSPAEFIYWWNNREGARRDRDRLQRGGREGEDGRRSVEGDRRRRRSAEGEGGRRSPEAEAEARRSSARER